MPSGIQINYSFGESSPGVSPSKHGTCFPSKKAVRDFVLGMDATQYTLRDMMLANRIKAAVQADATLGSLDPAIGLVSLELP